MGAAVQDALNFRRKTAARWLRVQSNAGRGAVEGRSTGSSEAGCAMAWHLARLFLFGIQALRASRPSPPASQIQDGYLLIHISF